MITTSVNFIFILMFFDRILTNLIGYMFIFVGIYSVVGKLSMVINTYRKRRSTRIRVYDQTHVKQHLIMILESRIKRIPILIVQTLEMIFYLVFIILAFIELDALGDYIDYRQRRALSYYEGPDISTVSLVEPSVMYIIYFGLKLIRITFEKTSFEAIKRKDYDHIVNKTQAK